MGLDDATIRLEPHKLLVYCPGGRLTDHADTEKTPGMIASDAVIVSSAYGAAPLASSTRERPRVS